jgi:hypothetical protein
MKKVLLFFLLGAGLSGSVQAEPVNISPNKLLGDSTATDISAMQQLLQEIINTTAVDIDLYLREADVLNLEASVSHRKKYISYNPSYINWLNTITGDKWAVLTLLAHEVGHHQKGHTTHRKSDRLAAELEADEFAGYILYKLGATLEQTQEVMKFIAKLEDSETHPARASRMAALKTGWDKASNETIAALTVKNP